MNRAARRAAAREERRRDGAELQQLERALVAFCSQNGPPAGDLSRLALVVRMGAGRPRVTLLDLSEAPAAAELAVLPLAPAGAVRAVLLGREGGRCLSVRWIARINSMGGEA